MMANEISDPQKLILDGQIYQIIDQTTAQRGVAWMREGEVDRFVFEAGAVIPASLTVEQVLQGDLHDPELVIRLFNGSHKYQAAIHSRGWRALKRIHGWEKLADLAAKSSWFANLEPDEVLDSLTYFSRVAGYDPVRDCVGVFDEVEETFTSESGESWSVD